MDSIRCKEDLLPAVKEEIEKVLQNALHDKAMLAAKGFWDIQGEKLPVFQAEEMNLR